MEALPRATGSTPASSEHPCKPQSFPTARLGKERKELSKIYQTRTSEWPVLTQLNRSAFLSISLFFAPDYGLQTNSQKYRMWEHLSKRAKPEYFQLWGRKNFFLFLLVVVLSSFLNFKTYRSLSKLINRYLLTLFWARYRATDEFVLWIIIYISVVLISLI